MRGRKDPQVTMLAFVDLESRVPVDHPLRTVKAVIDEALARLSPEFDCMYAAVGRPSIPPERLLKASLLIVFPEPAGEKAGGRDLRLDEDYRLVPPYAVSGAGPDRPVGVSGGYGIQPGADDQAGQPTTGGPYPPSGVTSPWSIAPSTLRKGQAGTLYRS